MSDTLPSASDVLGDRPDDLPTEADILGPRPTAPPQGFSAGRMLWTGPDADAFHAAAEPMGRVLRAFGQGAETAWDSGDNLGYSDDVNEALKKAGIYTDVAKGQGDLLRAYNEALIRPAVAATFGLVGAVGRGISAGITGAVSTGVQAATEIGGEQFGRGIGGVAEATLADLGSSIPLHGMLPRGELLGRELGRALSAAEVDHAAELGIIGPTARSSWQDTGYGGPVAATTAEPITPAVKARVSSLQDVARADEAAGKPPEADAPLAPTDIHEAARAVDPETFAAYDPLARQVDTLRDQIGVAQDELRRQAEAQAPHQAEIADLQDRLQDATPRLAKKYEARLAELVPARDAFLADDFTMAALTRDTPEIAAMRDGIQAAHERMADLAPEVTAAYREAAKQFPEQQAEPEPVQAPIAASTSAAAPVAAPVEPAPAAVAAPVAAAEAAEATAAPAAAAAPVAADRAAVPPAGAVPPQETTPINIREDVAQRLMAAGRPEDEARAAAEVVAAGYETRAARFGGLRGSAEDLYRAEAPDVVAGKSAKALELAQKGRVLEQAVYHGSPHIFDKFTLDHIGSGEGAQAYGHGLYFAGNKAVAKYYREALTQTTYDGAGYDSNSLAHRAAYYVEQRNGGDRAAAIKELDAEAAQMEAKVANLRRDYPSVTDDSVLSGIAGPYLDAQRRIAEIKSMIESGARLPEVKQGGRLYHVDIPEDHEYLDWDKPRDQLNSQVQAFAQKNYPAAWEKAADGSSLYQQMVNEADRPMRDARRVHDDAATYLADWEKSGGADGTGGDRASALAHIDSQLAEIAEVGRRYEAQGLSIDGTHYAVRAQRLNDIRPLIADPAWSADRPPTSNAAALVSQQMAEAGIPGIRYLDGSSRGAGEGSHNYVLFDADRINIREYEQTTRGKININDGRSVITLMGEANASTFLHETGHDWLEKLLADAKHPAAPDQLVADSKTVRDWLGAAPEAEITRAQHEKFARGFERYLMEGVAPSRALEGVFAQFKQWLTKIYQTVAKLRAPISDDIRQVFDRMLATPEERAVLAPERAAAQQPALELSGSVSPRTPYLKPGKEPTRLVSFLRRKVVQFPGTAQESTIPGGLRDPGGDISAMVGGPKGMPGLINNATGSSIHDALLRAWENGYFPEHGEHWNLEDNDLLRKMEEDLGGNPQYSIHDQDAVDAYHAALAHNAEVDRLAEVHGIDPAGMTQEQFFDAVSEKVSAEEIADSISNEESAHETAFDEYSEETRMWLEDHGVPWNNDGSRTLEDLEAERGQEAAARSAGEGQAGDDGSAAAGLHSGAGEESGGPRGRGAGPPGRAEAEGAQGVGGSDSAERGAADAQRSTDPGSPHADIEEPSELVDKAGNIRLDNLNSDEDVKQVLRDLAARNDDFMAARGGVIPDVQRRAMADALGLSPETFVPQKPEAVSPSVWAEAVQKLTFQASDAAARMGRIAGESGSPADLAAYLAAKQRLLLIADHFSTLTAEAGRTLRVFDKAGMQFTGDLVAKMEQDTGKTLFQMQQEARAVGALETTAQRSKMLQDMREPTRWQQGKSAIISYFINNLISGPITHAGYAVGNVVTALFKAVPLTLAEASIDTVRQALSDVPLADQVHFGEVGAQIYGAMHGAWSGFSPGWKAFKTGISTMEGADRLGRGGQDLLPGLAPVGDHPAAIGPAMEALGVPGGVARPVGYALETPSRLVQAIHTVFYSMNYEREIARRAFRAAANAGLTGDAFNTRVAELTQNPPLGLVQAAHDEAMSAVLMQKPAYGSGQQQFVALVNRYLPLKLAMPFMQIGMNILDEGLIKNTPLGLASQTVRDNLAGRNGEVARTQQYARIMVGSGIAAGVMTAAAQGILTGAGPTDQRERALKEATGWKAYSIRIGDTFIPYRKYLGPLGPLVGGAASIYEVGHLMGEGQLTKAVGAATLGFAHTVSDESWMQGVANLADAVTHWDRDGEKYLRNVALGFLPYSVGSGQVARLVDDSQREVHSWTAALRNQLPGLSEGLMPQRDWTGTPVGSHTMMSPSVFKNDPTMAAMEAAQFYPAKMQREVRGVPLSDQQYDDLTRVAGGLAKMRMDMLVRTPGFTALPAGLQNKQMQQTLESSRKVGEDWLLLQPGNANILRQATAAKAAQVQGQLPADVKAVRQSPVLAQ